MSQRKNGLANRYLLASDFDQTLSFNDCGQVLGELHGVSDFDEKIAELAEENFVQPTPWRSRCRSWKRCSAGIGPASSPSSSPRGSSSASGTSCRRTP